MLWLWVALVPVFPACGDDDDEPGDGDADADTDGDVDADGDGDGGAEADGGPEPDGGDDCGAETCNGLDDDCDGIADDGDPGAGQFCDPGLEGPCAVGITACVGGEFACQPEHLPGVEDCANPGVDDDCDGALDDIEDLDGSCDADGGHGRWTCVDDTLSCVALLPIAHWPAEGTAEDAAGDHDGVIGGGTSFATGVVGDAFGFDGVDDNVDVADAVDLNPTRALTVDLWVNVSDGAGLNRDIISKDGEAVERQFLLTASDADRFRAHVGVILDGQETLVWDDGDTAIELGRWYRVTMTAVVDGGQLTLRLYVDDVLDREIVTPADQLIVTPQPVRIGGGAPLLADQLFLPGLVDEILFYDVALRESEL